MNLEINRHHLSSEIEELATISEVRQDAIGNIFARWQGADSNAPAVGTGSHIDAIPNAGKYDGTVGVLGALEAIRTLQRNGFHPQRSIELLMFTSEEPTRFGIGCLGSRLLSGTLPVEAAKKLAPVSHLWSRNFAAARRS